jgi:hypothetical protein
MARALPLGLTACVIAALLAAPANASSGSIAEIESLGDGIFNATLTATSDRCASDGSCTWQAYATATAAQAVCDPAAGRVYTGPSHDAPGSEGPATQTFYVDTEGPFKLCLHIAYADGAETVAEAVYTPPGPGPPPCVPGPGDPACGGLPPRTDPAETIPRLSRSEAEAAARRYLRRHYPRARVRPIACSRLDTWTMRCRVRVRWRDTTYRGTVRLEAISATTLRVSSSITRPN